FYHGQLRRLGWSTEDLVAQANYWITTVCRQQEVPGIQAKTLGKMGLRGVRARVGRIGAGVGGGAAEGGSRDAKGFYGGGGGGWEGGL
ncbi:unnamed protein product, partial [Laminaria digitata]